MKEKTDLSKLSLNELEKYRKELLEVTELELLNVKRLIKLKSRKTKFKLKRYSQKKVYRKSYRFKADASMKTIFLLLDPILVLQIISELLDIEFDENMTITPLNTEHYHILDKITKSHVRGDLAFKICGINGTEEMTVVIELQSSKDKTMGFRMFVYSINHAKQIDNDGKKVYEFPKGLTIYTTDEISDEKGVDEVYFKLDNFSVEGYAPGKSSVRELRYNSNKGDLFKVCFPYINLFKMDLDDICKSALYVFSAVYLYKFRKSPELIKGIDVKKIISKINQSVAKYQGKNKEALQKIASDSYLDFIDILYSDKKRYEKELKQVNILTRTPTDILIEKARKEAYKDAEQKTYKKAEQKAEQKAKQKTEQKEFNMVLKMIKDNLSNESISNYSDFTVEEIAKIREEHSNL